MVSDIHYINVTTGRTQCGEEIHSQTRTSNDWHGVTCKDCHKNCGKNTYKNQIRFSMPKPSSYRIHVDPGVLESSQAWTYAHHFEPTTLMMSHIHYEDLIKLQAELISERIRKSIEERFLNVDLASGLDKTVEFQGLTRHYSVVPDIHL